ncbi:MAG: hypothetical protein JST87_15040 [Bacteroidetes bacterium]|nr:hypothetical protein [Bacteroidota bacterium]
MIFNSYEAALDELRPFNKLCGLFFQPVNSDKKAMQIRDVFVGISDPVVSKAIYLAEFFGEFPSHIFTNSDLQNIFFWAAFTNREIIPIQNLWEDEILKDIYLNDEFTKHIILSDNNWISMRLPRGLGFRVNFITDAKIEFRIEDINAGRRTGHDLERMEGGTFFISYFNETYELSNMTNPMLHIRAIGNISTPVEISLLFLQR